MTLQEHLDLVGWSAKDLADRKPKRAPVAIPSLVVERALAGLPITRGHAEQIVHKVSAAYDKQIKQPFQLGDFDGLQVVDPESLRKVQP